MEKPALKISLLAGDFCATNQGVPIALRPRSQQFLAYLVLHHQTPQPRRRIAGQLWPDTTDAQSRTNLRKELHYLRQTCPTLASCIAVTNQTLYWQPQVPCAVDVDAFKAALVTAASTEGAPAGQALETALTLYQSDLWPDCDTEWIYAERECLRQDYGLALARATRLFGELRETAKAISLGQQWLQAAPLNEEGYQVLMTLYEAAGDRASALQLYHRCMTTLQAELGVSPSAAIAEIYQRLLRADDSPAIDAPLASAASLANTALPLPETPLSGPKPLAPLVGREDLCQAMEQWLSLETAPLLVLTGEPGIGKTRLLEALVEKAAQHHFQPCWGQAFAAEQLRSYGVWIDLLQSASKLPQLRALSNRLCDVSGEGLRHREQLLNTVAEALNVEISARPLLMVFDDIHWLDDASATLLHYLFRLLSSQRLRIACATREQELQENSAVSDLLTALRRANRLQALKVSPLTPEGISALVQPLHATDPARQLDPQQIYADSGGNPLFALEVARVAAHKTNTLSALIDDRLQRLDSAARDLLPWAAALGQRFNPKTLALAAGYSPMPFLAAIEQLEVQQIICPARSAQAHLVQANTDYEFVHDLVRQVAYGQLSPPRRRLIHGQLAETLNAQTVEDDLASQVAYHAELAGNHALAAQACLAAAARGLRLFAYSDVIQLVEQGLDHGAHLPTRDRLTLTAQLLRVRVNAGVAPDDAADLEFQLHRLLSDMAGLALPEAEITAQEAINILNYDQGNLTTVHVHVSKLLDDLPPSPRLQAESLASNGCCLAEIERDMDRAEAVLLEAQSIADRLGLTLVDIPIGLGCVSQYRGDYRQARAYLRKALQLARNQQDLARQRDALNYLVVVGWNSNQPDVAEVEALLTLSAQLPQGSEGEFAQALLILSTHADSLKESDASTVALDEALHRLDQLDAQRKLVFVASHASEIALSRGHQDLAQRYGAIAYQAAQRVGHPNDLATAAALQILSVRPEDKLTHWRSLQPQITAQITEDFSLSARASALWARAQETVH
ncbi:MAG: AAA family ATPase [Elainellaceae cyanobacterium]